MKAIFKMMALLMLTLTAGACNDDDIKFVPTMPEVTNATLAGNWKLSELNGMLVSEDAYVYMQFVRHDQTFVIYDKMGSMYTHKMTGKYTYETDEYGVTTLSGRYDHQLDDNRWNHDYIIKELQPGITMTLTVKGDESETQKYIYVDAIPDSVLDELGNIEE